MPGSGYAPTVAGVPIKIDKTSSVPTYRQLADELTRLITERNLPVDQESGLMMLPSVHDLVQQTGLSQGTVQKATAELRRQGLVRTAPGRGVYVK